MAGQEEFHHQAAGFPDLGRVGMNHHALADRAGTGRGQGPHALDLNHADPAARIGLDVEVMAENGNVDAE